MALVGAGGRVLVLWTASVVGFGMSLEMRVLTIAVAAGLSAWASDRSQLVGRFLPRVLVPGWGRYGPTRRVAYVFAGLLVTALFVPIIQAVITQLLGA